MAKKFVKDSPLRKSVVGSFISSVPAPAEAPSLQDTESRNTVNTEIRKNGTKVKLTIVVPEEIDLLLEDIARKRRKETGRKPSKKELVIEAIRFLAKEEGLLG